MLEMFLFACSDFIKLNCFDELLEDRLVQNKSYSIYFMAVMKLSASFRFAGKKKAQINRKKAQPLKVSVW